MFAWILFVLMSALIVLSFVLPAPQQQIGEASRIFYYHIPQAWLSILAFGAAMVYSIRYLKTKDQKYDDRAVVSNALGLIFAILATVSGAIFAKVTWGAYWNWDPRQTSIFILLLIYGAYFSLRGALADEQKRAALTSVYAIFAFIPAVFLMFVFPRLTPSLHPSDTVLDKDLKFSMTFDISSMLFGSLVLFTMLAIWIFSIAVRTRMLERRLEEE